jgi:hypothetical protein
MEPIENRTIEQLNAESIHDCSLNKIERYWFNHGLLSLCVVLSVPAWSP